VMGTHDRTHFSTSSFASCCAAEFATVLFAA
jgi:hypothetical protein